MTLDSHQHFWHFDPIRDAWIDDTMQVIQRDFLPTDLKPVLAQCGVDGCVAVQAAQSDTETKFLLQLARENDFIKGVVGWIDLRADNLEAQIQGYNDQPLLKRFRHVLQAEPVEFMLHPAFVRGVQTIGKQGYTYDILIFPNQLPNAVKLVQQCGAQPFVLDHLAKPYIKDRKIDQWKSDLSRLAAQENVLCKISGMITEADWKSWTYEQLVPYLDVAFDAFGTDRLMFGSDWPVCQVAGEYQQVKHILERYLADFSEHEKKQVFGLNAAKFYRLD